MSLISPQGTYDDLRHLDDNQHTANNFAKSARYRQLAMDILADTAVSLDWREAIADRLNTANLWLGMREIEDRDDSY
jgi:hypothetical protein